MTPLCNLQNLSLSFPHKIIFNQITFTLNIGDRIGLLGLNGHGKSSLFKILNNEIPADTTVPPFIFDKSKNFSLFLVPQELPFLGEVTVEDYLYEFYPEFKRLKNELAVINQQLTDGEGDFEKLISKQTHIYDVLTDKGEERIQTQYLSYLKLFGMVDLTKTMISLSGGEQRKVALSLGLSCPHELVLWDEPTNHLDLETIEIFEDELLKTTKTIMMISHDRSLLNNVVDRIMHIQNGKLRSFQGTYDAYLSFLKEDQAKREKELDRLGNKERREYAWISRGAKARRTKSKKRIEDYDNLTETIRELKSKAHKSVQLDLKSTGRKSKVLVQGEDVSLRFGERTLFSNLNFKLAKGDKIALMGRNGTGKSSLLKLILGELAPTTGEIKKVDQLTTGYFSQKRESLKEDSTPWKIIGEGIDYVISNTGDKKHVASYLENFLFSSDEIKRPIHTFSGGEKNRLQLAQFMKHAMDLWIFDEPTNDLDLETIGILEEELNSYEGALIVVGHDRTFIQNVTNKCWLIHDEEVEFFEAGFEQAEIFMEALALEEAANKKSLLPLKTTKKIEKMTNKEKNRLDQLAKEIASIEIHLEELKVSLAKVDFSHPDSRKVAKEHEARRMKLENEKEHLFNEWFILEEKNQYP
jgi:ATP-binding cassette subfamily F protein uup